MQQVAHLAEFVQTTFRVVNDLDPLLGLGVSPLQSVLERGQPRIDLENTLAVDSCQWDEDATTQMLEDLLTSTIGGNAIRQSLATVGDQRVGRASSNLGHLV